MYKLRPSYKKNIYCLLLCPLKLELQLTSLKLCLLKFPINIRKDYESLWVSITTKKFKDDF